MIYLDRFKSDSSGTFGMLTDDDDNNLCYTVELPWLDNHPQTSCIPIGVYAVIKYDSPKHGDVWQIVNVPNRLNIEIHPANTPAELLGCVGVGNALGTINGLKGVLNSDDTFAMLKAKLPSSFQLTIA